MPDLYGPGIAANQAAQKAVRDRVVAFVSASWYALGSYRDADIDRFVALIVPMILAGQRTIAQLTDSYLAMLAAQEFGGTAQPVGVPMDQVTGAAVRQGTPPAEVYQRAGVTVWAALAGGVALDVAVQRGADRAVKAAQTDLQLAKTHTAQKVLARDPRASGWRRTLEGATSCGLCVLASTQRYTREDLMAIHPGCVPAGTRVRATGVLAVSRRWYSGELAIITTASGDEVTVTTNHPVLTDQGWIPGGLVREGHHLIRSLGPEREVDRGPDERQAPALIEDVWRSASVARRLLQVPLSAKDFHADRADGEVEVVWTDGDLAAIGGVSFGQPSREGLLVDGHGGGRALLASGDLAPLLETDLAAGGGLVGGSGLSLALLEGHVLGPDQTGGAAPTRFDAPPEEFSPESASVYASRGMDLVGRLAGEVERDRVVNARRVSWSDHVYNLHTVEGWYESSNHIVSNCDCGVAPIYGPDRHVIAPDQLDALHAQAAEFFGISRDQALGATAGTHKAHRAIDYRDLVVVHQHGELGPVLGRKGQHFTSADQIPA